MLQFSPELSEFLEQKIKTFGYRTEKKKMFGHETFFLNGYLFSGANVSGIFAHVGKVARDDALEQVSGAIPFEPMEGMVMKEYILLQKPVYSNEKDLKKWLDQAAEFLMSLPPKTKKKRKG